MVTYPEAKKRGRGASGLTPKRYKRSELMDPFCQTHLVIVTAFNIFLVVLFVAVNEDLCGSVLKLNSVCNLVATREIKRSFV